MATLNNIGFKYASLSSWGAETLNSDWRELASSRNLSSHRSCCPVADVFRDIGANLVRRSQCSQIALLLQTSLSSSFFVRPEVAPSWVVFHFHSILVASELEMAPRRRAERFGVALVVAFLVYSPLLCSAWYVSLLSLHAVVLCWVGVGFNSFLVRVCKWDPWFNGGGLSTVLKLKSYA
jgi:hypothetical protein